MTIDPSVVTVSDWRAELPTLASRGAALREIGPADLGAIADLLSIGDASRFGLDYPITDHAVQDFIARAQRERAAGQSFTFAIMSAAGRPLAGLIQVRQLDPSFEAGEWEATLQPSARGTGIFLESARLVGSFAFRSVGIHRLEARVLLQNGRANGALRKLGAVQEGILRRSVRRGGDYFDQVLWSVLKEDWTEHWLAPGSRVH